jgi:hypothetical protein
MVPLPNLYVSRLETWNERKIFMAGYHWHSQVGTLGIRSLEALASVFRGSFREDTRF